MGFFFVIMTMHLQEVGANNFTVTVVNGLGFVLVICYYGVWKLKVHSFL